MEKVVHFIITGGTIDSVFSPVKDAIIVNDHSVILGYINAVIKPHVQITSETLTLKDSREITDNIRNEMLRSIQKAETDAIVITHGTYTMAETARYLKKALAPSDKTVVLTGSMLPLKGFSESDATFNLGYAIAAAKLLPPGVYVAMNGHMFDADDVEKDVSEGVFTSKS